jgi:hypothetical protein
MSWYRSIQPHFGGQRRVLRGGHVLRSSSVVHSGTAWRGGEPAMERNPDLRDLRARTRHLQQMERTDPTLHALVSLTLDAACEATPVAIERKGVASADIELHRRVCEDVRLMFGWEGRPSKLRGPDGGPPQTWAQVCAHLMLSAPYGFSVAPFFTYAGEGGLPWVREFALVDLASVDKWNRDEAGRIIGWRQYAESGQARRDFDVARDDTVIVTHRGHGDDPEGAAILRACYAHHNLKRQAVESTGQTTDKAGVPPVVVDFDLTAMIAAGYTEDAAHEARVAAELQAERFNRREGGSLTNLPGVSFRFMDTAFDPSSLLAVEAQCDEAFGIAFQAPLSLIGRAQGSTAQNVGDVQRDGFLRHVASRLDDVLDALATQVVAKVIRARYGDRGAQLLPVITHTGLRPSAIAQAMPYLNGLVAGGILKAGIDLTRAINEELRLPPDAGIGEAMAEATRAQVNTASAQVPGPGRGHVGDGAIYDDTSQMGADSDPEDWVPAKDAARRFGASASSLATLHGKGEVRRITLNGRHKYLISDIEQALGLRDSEGDD